MAKKNLKYYVRPETGQDDVIGPTYGPFDEFIQLTYTEIRVGPDGATIGYHDEEDGLWHFPPTYRPQDRELPIPCNRSSAHNCPERTLVGFSDVVIWAE
jgi:hypothetical protein